MCFCCSKHVGKVRSAKNGARVALRSDSRSHDEMRKWLRIPQEGSARLRCLWFVFPVYFLRSVLFDILHRPMGQQICITGSIWQAPSNSQFRPKPTSPCEPCHVHRYDPSYLGPPPKNNFYLAFWFFCKYHISVAQSHRVFCICLPSDRVSLELCVWLGQILESIIYLAVVFFESIFFFSSVGPFINHFGQVAPSRLNIISILCVQCFISGWQ